MFYSKKFKKFYNLKHCFFSRKGGFSRGLYKGLNCGRGSKDKKKNIIMNLKKVAKKMSVKNNHLILMYQTHSNKVIEIKKNNYKKKIRADAMVTKMRGIALGVVTADCVPILVFDNQRKMIAAIHAGWKGAFKGIVSKVIKFMIKKGSKTKNITAVIGPAISVKNYEVKKDFYKKFTRKDRTNHKFFKMGKEKLYFNLSSYVKSLILKSGVKKIEKIDVDTFDAKNKFFSARRSKSLNHADYGRNISIIMLN